VIIAGVGKSVWLLVYPERDLNRRKPSPRFRQPAHQQAGSHILIGLRNRWVVQVQRLVVPHSWS